MNPQRLYWLLLNVAVVVRGLSITQYATFEDLDTPSSCHVGILAKDTEGTIWIFHNNGNETHTMKWSEYELRWESHRMKISDWKSSAIGTSLESAAREYEQFLDNCYNARDAVVRYFSGGNGTLNLSPDQMCPPSRTFCGHDPEVQAMMGMSIGHNQQQKVLLTCGTDGRISRVDICNRNCTNREDKPGYSQCECTPDFQYCGHEMRAFGGSDEYDNQTLYLCQDGSNVSSIQKCFNECVALEENSMCSGYCVPNKSYCGGKLLEMGLKGYDTKTAYRCDSNGRSGHSIANCSEECRNDGKAAYCTCHPGRTYCVHELYGRNQMNWWWMENGTATHPHQLVRCLPKKDRGKRGFTCSNCIASHGEKDAFCQWTEGVLCGRALMHMGWPGYENDTLYQCGNTAGNTTVIAGCLEGTCREDTCDCLPNRTYCGHQLYSMGWTNYGSEENKASLKQCKTDGKAATTISKCETCTNSGGHARCACTGRGLYCGHELDGDPQYSDKAIYRCNQEGRANLIQTCNSTCIRLYREDPACPEECRPGETYCGSRLLALGFTGYDSDNIYSCSTDGRNLTMVESCTNGCIDKGKKPVCSGYCTPNQAYCGRKLTEMGIAVPDPKAIYQCDTSGKSAHNITQCPDDCREENSGEPYCPCRPGRIYCMNELYPRLHWSWAKMINRTTPHQTMKCEENGYGGLMTSECTICAPSRGDEDAYCQWTAGAFCGRYLNQLGWSGYENDTLYQCADEENKVSVISKCFNGTCRERSCSCIPGQAYCFHQLLSMGFRVSGFQLTDLMQCGIHGADADIILTISKCKECTNSGGHARCACMAKDLYCGHELEGNPPYEDRAIYQCNQEGRASLIKTCKSSCVRPVEGMPSCLGECTPGETACGSKLLALGYTGFSTTNLYSCSEDGQSLEDTGQKDPLCVHCTRGRSYCGHQLRNLHHVAESGLEVRFMCKHNGLVEMEQTAQCSKCINQSDRAYCQCSPGQLYCGREAYSNGWKDHRETIRLPANFTNDTLLRCVQEEAVEVVAHCPYQECMTRVESSYCLCTPGRVYCGHQLDPNYNSIDTYLFPNSIYQCSDTKLWVKVIRKCGTCVSINGEPQCRQQCIHGSHYCGSDLLGMEGWDELEDNVLYQCTNGSFASIEQNCTRGCHAKIGMVDAYCLGMPTPWYWFLMATVLPLIFISLSMGLIRIIIKHRRLQNFVSQQRINAHQLTLVRKLGHGQFGEVWQSKYTDPSGQKMDVAVKISKHHLNTNPGLNLASANCFFQESVALDFLRHQNITRALGICSNLKMVDGMTTPALVLEYMDGGNSADYVLKEREHLQTSDLMRLFIDICQAGEHLQKMGVIHRDIAARNVLIGKNPRNGKPAVAKLTDFGLAKDIGKNAGHYRTTNPDRAMFHEGYTAPEGFKGEFSSQSDVWSFGVFMWELYTLMDKKQTQAVAPYSDVPSQDRLKEISNGYRLRRPLLTPTHIYSIMTSCWAWMPESRPTFRQLKQILQANRTREFDMEPLMVRLDTEDDESGEINQREAEGGQEAETEFSEHTIPFGAGYACPAVTSDVRGYIA